MDDAQKRVLKRKKNVFQDHVDVTNDFLSELHGRHLLDDDAMDTLMDDKMSNGRASRMIDYILLTVQPDAFQTLCAALVRDYPWLTKELELDLRIEKAEIDIDEDVAKEAAMLVHRKFGQSKRFSEVDKKDIQDLIAVKVQLSKEEWKKEMMTLRDELERQIELHKVKDAKAGAVDRQVVDYMRAHDDYLKSHAHGMKTTRSALVDSVNDNDVIAKLRARLDFMMDRLNYGIKNAEMLQKERERCLELLNCKKGDTEKLYDIIQLKMVEFPNKIDTLSKSVKSKDSEINNLKKQITEKNESVRANKEEMRSLEQHVLQKEAENSILQDKLKELQAHANELADRLAATAQQRKKSAGSKSRKS